MNRYYYSDQQREEIDRIHRLDDEPYLAQVLVNGEWKDYTQWTSSKNGKCPWEDAQLVAESETELPLRLIHPNGETGYFRKRQVPLGLL